MVIFSYVLFSEFVLFVLFFFCFVFFAVFFFFFFTLGCSTGLALKFHDNLDLVLYTTTTVNNWRFFFTLTRLNFQKRKVNIYDFSATFCFIVVFVSLHQHQLHRRQFTFLKGDQGCYFHLHYFILSLFSIHSISIDINRRLLSIDIGNR